MGTNPTPIPDNPPQAPLISQKTLAQAAGWIGSAVFILASAGLFGHYSAVVKDAAVMLAMGGGVHLAAGTSNTNPNGK